MRERRVKSFYSWLSPNQVNLLGIFLIGGKDKLYPYSMIRNYYINPDVVHY